jgi:hypothetical protein
MQLSDLDKELQEFVLRLAEKTKIIQIEVVQSSAGREELAITGALVGRMMFQTCYIWKNPDNSYGWSHEPDYGQINREKFMGDIKRDSNN